MSEGDSVLLLQDLDLMLAELSDAKSLQRLRKLGFGAPERTTLVRARAKVLGQVEGRWLKLYERAASRFGRAVAIVRDRVCLGCFITLPTSASPAAGEVLTLCESCGRILYWR